MELPPPTRVMPLRAAGQERVFILAPGAQVVSRVKVRGPDGQAVPPRGAVGVVVCSRSLRKEFDASLAQTRAPEGPDYDAANSLLITARRSMP